MEKMTVAEALDEKDYLATKIVKDINNLKTIAVKRTKDTTLRNGMNPEDFKQRNSALYQSIVDQIKRYKRIVSAITMSNANTTITLRNGESMTVAEAIAIKNMIQSDDDFTRLLNNTLINQYENGKTEYETYMRSYKNQRDEMMNTLLNSSSDKLDDNQIASVDRIVEGYYPEMIDCISTNKESFEELISDCTDYINNMTKYINSAIRLSNATTEIEF